MSTRVQVPGLAAFTVLAICCIMGRTRLHLFLLVRELRCIFLLSKQLFENCLHPSYPPSQRLANSPQLPVEEVERC